MLRGRLKTVLTSLNKLLRGKWISLSVLAHFSKSWNPTCEWNPQFPPPPQEVCQASVMVQKLNNRPSVKESAENEYKSFQPQKSPVWVMEAFNMSWLQCSVFPVCTWTLEIHLVYRLTTKMSKHPYWHEHIFVPEHFSLCWRRCDQNRKAAHVSGFIFPSRPWPCSHKRLHLLPLASGDVWAAPDERAF